MRELEHCIEAAVVLTHEGWIAAESLGEPTRGGGGADPLLGASLAEVERRHIQRVLASVDGNRSRAADILGIGRSTLARRLKGLA